MTTATGEVAFNFATQSNENPFVDPLFTARVGTTQIASGLLKVNSAASLIAYTGSTYDGGSITTAIEVNATAVDDECLLGALDQNGDGYLLRVGPTSVIVLVYDNYAVIDSAGSATITFTANDLFTFTLTKGSPNSYSATRNGSAITLSQTTDATLTLATLESIYGGKNENVGAAAIKSFAVVDGTASSSPLAGAANAVATAAAALLTAIRLAANAAAVSTGTGALTTSPRFASSAVATATATGALTNWSTVTLAGTLYTGAGGVLDPNFWVGDVPTVGTTIYYDGAHITIAPNGEISSNQNPTSAVVGFAGPNGWATGVVFFTPYMVGYANDVVTATGALSTSIRLAASASALASATGVLTGTPAQLNGSALSVATAAAQLLTAIKLQGAATASAAASAQFTSTAAQLAGAAQDIAAAAGLLTTGKPLDGHAADISTAIGSLLTAIKLQGSASDVATATAALASTSAQLSGAALDVATAVAILSTGIPLDGHAATIVSASAQLSTVVSLFGNALAEADATGVINKLLATITVRPPFRVPIRRGRFH